MTQAYQIAAYYFPQYHPDPRNDRWHGQGWTEWELLKRAQPRFPGHRQPKIPLWGYQNESRPEVAAHKIATAADHGITTFIYDWYWYENGPFLQGALERGFLQAHNNDRLTFALMWANHDWINLFPARRGVVSPPLARGTVSRAQFDAATAYMVEHYLAHPSYWRIDGRPYVSIYEMRHLVDGLGGVDAAREAFEGFRYNVRSAGLGDLHLNAVVWGLQSLPGRVAGGDLDTRPLLAALGVDSLTSYVWIHHTPLDRFPTVSYPAYAQEAAHIWERFAEEFGLPYYPNVTMGWDASPRTAPSDRYEPSGYPFLPVLDGNTPEEFGRALERAKVFLDRGGTHPPILTINAWNEWTEGSYLEPDTVSGMAYLEAIKRVFGRRA